METKKWRDREKKTKNDTHTKKSFLERDGKKTGEKGIRT